MKILHIHPSMAGGGIEAMICALVNEMSKSNDVTLCTIYSLKKNDVFEQKLSASVHRISLGKNKEGFSVKEIFKIYNVIRNGNYDVVHIHAEGPAFFSFIPKLLGKKVVVTVHGLDWDRAKWGKFASWYIRTGEKNAVKFADEIIVLSQGVKDYFWNTYKRKTQH